MSDEAREIYAFHVVAPPTDRCRICGRFTSVMAGGVPEEAGWVCRDCLG